MIPMGEFGVWMWSCHFVSGTVGSMWMGGTGDRTGAPVVILFLYSTSNLNWK